MKKITHLLIAIACVAIFAIGCDKPIENKTTYGMKIGSYDTSEMYVIVIDGCEYLYCSQASASWGTHKGNCKNPIHQKVIHDTVYLDKK